MNTLYVAWQDAATREWIPVAKLERIDEGYRLSYTAGARRAAGFHGLGRMALSNNSYESPVLFAPFANRLLSKTRPEYSDFLRWTGLAPEAVDPMQILGITGGIRGTDSLELFSLPKFQIDGKWNADFFLRGIRHLPDAAKERVGRLKPNDRLRLVFDFQNDVDLGAVGVRTEHPATFIGYCPKYYCHYIHKAFSAAHDLTLHVRRVNDDAPTSMRLLCTLEGAGYDVDQDLKAPVLEDFQPY